jgi:hypothetical protein
MNIRIKITNAKTLEVITDNTVTIHDYDFQIAEANHEFMSQSMPECFVNFSMDNGDFICGMPWGMKEDQDAYYQGRLTYEEYCQNWYQGDLAGCNQD